MSCSMDAIGLDDEGDAAAGIPFPDGSFGGLTFGDVEDMGSLLDSVMTDVAENTADAPIPATTANPPPFPTTFPLELSFPPDGCSGEGLFGAVLDSVMRDIAEDMDDAFPPDPPFLSPALSPRVQELTEGILAPGSSFGAAPAPSSQGMWSLMQPVRLSPHVGSPGLASNAAPLDVTLGTSKQSTPSSQAIVAMPSFAGPSPTPLDCRHNAVLIRPGNSIGQGYAKPTDWAARKAEIGRLYLDYGLTLDDVMKLMAERHRFRATKKMYKSQFTKWGWQKYNKSKTAVCGAAAKAAKRACIRSQKSRTAAMSHANTAMRLMDEALSFLQGFLRESLRNELQREPLGKYDIVGRRVSAIDDDLWSALNYFEVGNNTTGGTLLRKAFYEIEGMLQDLDASLILGLVIDAVEYLSRFDKYDLAMVYLSHLGSLSVAKAHGHTIGRVSSLLRELWKLQSRNLAHFVGVAYEMWADLVGDLCGAGHCSSVWAKNNSIRAQFLLGIRSGSGEWDANRCSQQYDRLLEEAQVERASEDNDDTIIRIKYDRLQMEYSFLRREDPDTVAEHCRQMMDAIGSRYGQDTLPDGEWKPFHAKLYWRCFWLLARIHAIRDDVEAAVGLVAAFLRHVGSCKVEVNSAEIGLIVTLIEDMEDYGREDLAEGLERFLPGMEYFQSAVRTVEELDSQGIDLPVVEEEAVDAREGEGS